MRFFSKSIQNARPFPLAGYSRDLYKHVFIHPSPVPTPARNIPKPFSIKMKT